VQFVLSVYQRVGERQWEIDVSFLLFPFLCFDSSFVEDFLLAENFFGLGLSALARVSYLLGQVFRPLWSLKFLERELQVLLLERQLQKQERLQELELKQREVEQKQDLEQAKPVLELELAL